MFKRIIFFVLLITLLLTLVGCGCDHRWVEADCYYAKHCELCGATAGNEAGHDWIEATCEAPKTCARCGLKEDSALGHDWAEATMEAPKTCKRCGGTNGDKLKLSDACDKVLASGTDANGDVYELVANEKDAYDGTKVQVGVIKNGKWLRKLTSNMPLVDKDGTIYGSKSTTIHANLNLEFFYIGNGCFLCESSIPEGMSMRRENIIYNSETQQFFEKEFSTEDKHICVTYHCFASWSNLKPDYSAMKLISKKHSLVITDFKNYSTSSEIEVLDTNKMTTKILKLTLPEKWQQTWQHIGYVYPVSEGMFAVTNNNATQIAFYDQNGKLLFDKDYTLNTEKQNIVFVNGKCTFTIRNNANKQFQITIDKTGKVLESKEI